MGAQYKNKEKDCHTTTPGNLYKKFAGICKNESAIFTTNVRTMQL